MKPANQPDIPKEPEPLNEESVLREEESRAKYDRRMEEMDRRDKAGTHWIHRG